MSTFQVMQFCKIVFNYVKCSIATRKHPKILITTYAFHTGGRTWEKIPINGSLEPYGYLKIYNEYGVINISVFGLQT